MLGMGAQAFAQASKQTKKVVSSNQETLSENVALDTQQAIKKEPDRGIPTPKFIEDLLMNQEYNKAVEEFEKFIKTAKATPCDLLYLPYTFYSRMESVDNARKVVYRQKKQYYIDEFQSACGNSVEAYIMKDQESNPRIPDSTVQWMTMAIAVEPTYAALYSIRGEALWQLQRKKEACVDFEKAIELNNDGFAVEFHKMNCLNLPEDPVEETVELGTDE